MKRGVDDRRNDDLASLHRSEALRKTSIPDTRYEMEHISE